MFNGIIRNTGVIINIERYSNSMIISVKTNLKVKKNIMGSSISCDGVCLTLISKKNNLLNFIYRKKQ